VGFAERMAAGYQRDRFFVVHRHPRERFPNVAGRSDRIRVSVRSLRINVDQAHLNVGERFGEVTIAAVAFVSEPRALRPEINHFVRLPNVLAPAAKTERLESHRL